jgi:hypothetical protein
MDEIEDQFHLKLPKEQELPYGAIIGLVTLEACVSGSESRWYQGPCDPKGKPVIGWVLTDPRPVPLLRTRNGIRVSPLSSRGPAEEGSARSGST